MIRAAIFDLDGTLVDSLPGIADGLNRALESKGRPPHSLDRIGTFIGNGAWMLAKRGLTGDPSKEEVNELQEAFFREYGESWLSGTTLYPGLRELLEELHEENIPLAVCSNKPHHYTVEIMQTLFDWVPWVMVLGQQKIIPRKPDPTGALMIAEKLALPPSEIAFVGDSTVDFETGEAAGMQAVLVNWGFHSSEMLRATKAPLMQSAAELCRHLLAPHRGE